MPSILLDSQLATLEEPGHAIPCDLSEPPESLARQIANTLRLGLQMA